MRYDTSAGLQVSGEIFTSGTFLTQATSDSPISTTLNVGNTSSFSASGSGYIVDSTNNHDAFSWTGKTATTLTGCSGVLAHNAGAIVIENDAIVISKKNGRAYFYGNGGAGNELLAAIGLSSYGGSISVASFGSMTAGNVRQGVSALAKTAIAISAASDSNYGVSGTSNEAYGVRGISSPGSESSNAAGVYGTSFNSYGVYGFSNASYGGVFRGGASRGPILLEPSASASAPTHSSGKGTLWVTSAGILYINTDGSTTWAKVGAQ